MQQTLLALLALLIATFLNFNQMQADVQSQRQTIQSEMAQMALGIAMQTMEVVRARAFDDATEAVPEDEYLDPKADDFALKSEGDFGITGECKLHPGSSGQDCDAIEEFHGTTEEVPFQLSGDTYSFTVHVEVYYVCANMDRAADTGTCSPPTGGKEVVIEVQDTPSSNGNSYLREPISYSEVITYP